MDTGHFFILDCYAKLLSQLHAIQSCGWFECDVAIKEPQVELKTKIVESLKLLGFTCDRNPNKLEYAVYWEDGSLEKLQQAMENYAKKIGESC